MEIYVLKWSAGNNVLEGDPAYTDRERAERNARYANKHIKWWHRLSGGHWIVSTLNLREGRGKVHNV